MSVSSHLTPEPERRLWLILEGARGAVESADRRIAGISLLALIELGWLHPFYPFALMLAGALPLAVFAYSPLTGLPGALSAIDPPFARQSVDDNLVSVDDMIKYSHGELIHKLDKYLGGGITATQYYEDLIGQILINARVAVRKKRLFQLLCLIVGLAQAGLLIAR